MTDTSLIFLGGTAALCFVFPHGLAETASGQMLLAGMALFRIGRMIEQWTFLPYNRLPVHALTVLFLLGAGLFAAPLFNRAIPTCPTPRC